MPDLVEALQPEEIMMHGRILISNQSQTTVLMGMACQKSSPRGVTAAIANYT